MHVSERRFLKKVQLWRFLAFPLVVTVFLAGFAQSAWGLGPLAGSYPRLVMVLLGVALAIAVASDFTAMVEARRAPRGGVSAHTSADESDTDSRRIASGSADASHPRRDAGPIDAAPNWRAAIALIGITMAFAWLIPYVGLRNASAVFLATALVSQRVRSPLQVGIVAVGGWMVIWLLFETLLGLRLPRGSLFASL